LTRKSTLPENNMMGHSMVLWAEVWIDTCDSCYYENGYVDACVAMTALSGTCDDSDIACLLDYCMESKDYYMGCVWDDCYSGTQCFLGFIWPVPFFFSATIKIRILPYHACCVKIEWSHAWDNAGICTAKAKNIFIFCTRIGLWFTRRSRFFWGDIILS